MKRILWDFCLNNVDSDTLMSLFFITEVGLIDLVIDSLHYFLFSCFICFSLKPLTEKTDTEIDSLLNGQNFG